MSNHNSINDMNTTRIDEWNVRIDMIRDVLEALKHPPVGDGSTSESYYMRESVIVGVIDVLGMRKDILEILLMKR